MVLGQDNRRKTNEFEDNVVNDSKALWASQRGETDGTAANQPNAHQDEHGHLDGELQRAKPPDTLHAGECRWHAYGHHRRLRLPRPPGMEKGGDHHHRCRNRRRDCDDHAASALHLPRLFASGGVRSDARRPSLSVARHVGSNSTNRHAPAGHPKRRRMVLLRLGLDKKTLAKSSVQRGSFARPTLTPPTASCRERATSLNLSLPWSGEYADVERGLVYCN